MYFNHRLVVSSQLAKSYGNVYSLFIGPKPVVIINGVKAMKEAMVTKAIDFAGRPQDLFINDVTRRKGEVDIIRCTLGAAFI